MTNPLEIAQPLAGRAAEVGQQSPAHSEAYDSMESMNKHLVREQMRRPADLDPGHRYEPMLMGPEWLHFDDMFQHTEIYQMPDGKHVVEPKIKGNTLLDMPNPYESQTRR